MTGMWDFKFTDVGLSQKGNTRARYKGFCLFLLPQGYIQMTSRSVINCFRTKVHRVAECYCAVCHALLTLNPANNALTRLKVLSPQDVHCPQREEKELRPGESRREISWIWLSVATGSEGVKRQLEAMEPVSIRDINGSKWYHLLFTVGN